MKLSAKAQRLRASAVKKDYAHTAVAGRSVFSVLSVVNTLKLRGEKTQAAVSSDTASITSPSRTYAPSPRSVHVSGWFSVSVRI